MLKFAVQPLVSLKLEKIGQYSSRSDSYINAKLHIIISLKHLQSIIKQQDLKALSVLWNWEKNNCGSLFAKAPSFILSAVAITWDRKVTFAFAVVDKNDKISPSWEQHLWKLKPPSILCSELNNFFSRHFKIHIILLDFVDYFSCHCKLECYQATQDFSDKAVKPNSSMSTSMKEKNKLL